MVIAATLLFLSGCKPEVPFIEASPATVIFPQEGGTQSVSLSTNSMSWTASVSGKGFSVSPASGAGNASLQLTAAASTSSSDQTGTLTIKSGTMQASVAITQSARNTLIVNGANAVEASGGTYTLTLQYNTAYTVEIEEASKSWIQYSGTKAMSTATLQFLIAPNPGSPRSGKVSVRDNAGIAQTQTFTFNQKENALRTVLVQLYDNLDGNNWIAEKKTNWKTEEPIDKWAGLTMEEGKITQLNLSGFGLNGQLPSDIGTLTDLTRLTISSNPGLTGPLPSTIGNLANLDALLAVTTGLQGPLPKEMGNLKKITNLQLNNNNIDGKIPEEWGGMEALKNFGMFNTKISGPLPKTIFEQWKHIGSILLHSNPNLTGSLPPQLGQMETDNTLFSVQLYNCNFEGGIPEEWGSMPAVSKQLHLYGNKLTEPVPLAIQNHPSWTTDKWDKWKDAGTHFIRTQQNGVFLELEKVPDAQRDCLMALYNALDGPNWTKGTNWNTDEEISTWEGVTVTDEAITGLNLSGFGLKGQLPPQIGELTALKSLNLGNNPNLAGPLPAEMGNLNKLTNLQLNNNMITGTIPREWGGMTALNNFGMFNTKISGPIPSEIFTGWKNLGTFLMNNNPNLTGSLPEGLGNMITTQTRFNIHLHECNFTGGIPASWGNIPVVSAQLRVYGNKLTEPVPAVIINHPSWTSDKWDSYKTNTEIHYIRTQQDGVFLDMEGVLPTVGRVTVTELSYNKISVSAEVLKQGSHAVTERGFVLNATTRQAGAGTGVFSSDITNNIQENTAYTIKAYAKSQAGTAYGEEVTVTTPRYNELNMVLTDNTDATVDYADVYLKLLSSEKRAASPAYVPISAKALPVIKGRTQAEVLQSALYWLSSIMKPFAPQIRKNLEALQTGTLEVPAVRSASIRPANTDDYDYKVTSSSGGNVQIKNVVPGTYGVRVVGYGLIKDFYTLLTIPEGVTNISVEDIPLLPVTSGTLSLFRPNAGLRPFSSPAADDDVMVLVQMTPDFVSTWKGKILENILLCPMDTTSSIVIMAKDQDQLAQIYEIFLSLTDEEGNPQKPEDPMKFLDFIETLSRRIVMIQDPLVARTNLVPQSTLNLKKYFVDAIKASGQWDLIKTFVTENYNVQIQEGNGVILNMIIKQQGTKPVLMTDGNGPAQEGGNLLLLSSEEGEQTTTTLGDLGYNGNWHLGITVR